MKHHMFFRITRFLSYKSMPLLFFLSLFLSVTAQIKPTTAEERLKAGEKRKELERKSLLLDVKFRNIGPSVMSGRVTDLDVNPDDPTEFYVAYASGGLWHTTNNGQSFTPIFDNEDVMTIGDIAVQWKGQRTIWLGTGEVNSSRSSYAGNGIYKSVDNGKSWQYVGLPESHHIGKIQLHPSDPNTAWVAVLGHLYSPNKERGVFKTTDGGTNWKLTLYVDDNTGAVDLDINPANPQELYAAVWYRTRRAWKFEESGPTTGIYKSADGGETWKLASGPGSGFAEGKKLGRIGITVFPQNPNIVYAVIDNNEPRPDTSRKTTAADTALQLSQFKTITNQQLLDLDSVRLERFLRRQRYPAKYTAGIVKEMVRTGKIQATALWDYFDTGDDGFTNSNIRGCEVYRSDDAGKTWRKTHEKPISTFNTYGYYFAKIYTSHTNSEKVFVLGFNALISTDGGKNFKVMDKGNVHADHHALWVNPRRDSHLINGNDGGINITYDDGDHWYKANAPSVGQFYAIAVDNEKPYNVYGGLQDNGTWYGPSNNKENTDWHDNGNYAFKFLNGGDGMQVQVDTRDNTTVYTGYQFGAYVRMDRMKSSTRVNVRPSHELGEKPLRFNWQTPILLSQHNMDVFYYGSNRFHRSMNKGENAQNLSGDLTGGRKEGNVPFGTLVALSESPLRFGLIYTGSDDGMIHVSKDGGYTWTPLHNKLPKQVQGLYVSRIIASRYAEGRVYATLNGYRNDHFNAYVFVSEDYGTTWRQICNDLPAEPVNVIREDPKQEQVLYIGTDHGLYVTLNRGTSSMAWMAGLPRVAVHDIAIQERENEIVLGTHGRSIYIAPIKEVQKLAAEPGYAEQKLKTVVK